MARFCYTTEDAQGKPVSGEIEAAGESEAREKLTAQGFKGDPASLLAVADESPGARLSAGEASELVGQVAALAKAGLPLGPGLRALAEELPGRRLRRALKAIADCLDRGATLEEAVAAEEARLPVHLRGLIVAGARSGRLADVLQESLAMERSRGQIRRSVWLSLAYPTLLFGILVLIFAFFSLRIVPQFAAIFRDFGTDLPAITQAILWVCNPTAGMGAILLLIVMVGMVLFLSVSRPNTPWAQEVFYVVPIVGPMWKRYGLAEFARLMALSLDMEMPLPAAPRLTADALREADLKRACRRVAERIEIGTSLTEAIAASRTFPRRLLPLVEWGQRTPAMAEAFRAAAEMFEGEVGVQRTLLDVVILPIMLVVVVGYVGFFIIALFLPLISLITKLSGELSMPDSAIYLIGALTPILLGIAILVTLLVFPREQKGEKADLVRLALTIVGWAFIAIGTLIVLGVGMGLAPAVLAVIVGAMVFQRSRGASRRALLLTLAVAAERRIPLIPALEAYAADHRGAIGKRALLLAHYLGAGWPLPDAMGRIGGLASPDALIFVRVGHESGALATALRNAATLGMSEGTFGTPSARQNAGGGGLSEGSIWGSIAGRVGYLCVLLMFASGIITFMMLKITPTFERIFKDFGTELPGVTRALIFGSNAVVQYWFLGGFLPPLLVFLMAYTGLRFIGVIRFDLPGLGWLTWRVHTAAVLDALALAAGRERPLPETLSILGQHYPKRSIRWRLYGVLVDVQGGGDWVDSLHQRGLIGQAEQGVLKAAVRVGNLPWALAAMADSARRRLAYRLQALLQVLFPLVILSFGTLVMFLAVGYFIPLIALITKLAG